MLLTGVTATRLWAWKSLSTYGSIKNVAEPSYNVVSQSFTCGLLVLSCIMNGEIVKRTRASMK